jgi:ABC-type Zn uptake system ZnuABC Zn-binding protein ZnuA
MNPVNRRTLLGAAAAIGGLVAGRRLAFAQASATPAAALELTPLPTIAAPNGKKKIVVATTPLLADLARQIGGDRIDASSILPADADPHEFEPSPQDLVKAADADLILEHGLHLDDWAKDLVENADSNALVLVATKNVKTIAAPDGGDENFDEGDPHVWFDPRNIEIMVKDIAAALTQIDADGAEGYAARLASYTVQLTALDAWIAAQIESIPMERRKLVTNHDAFGYFVARYNIAFVGAVIPSIDSRAEPSAKETAALIDKIKSEGVPAIFTESTINPKLEDELGKQAGVKVIPNLYGDNLGPAGSGADTYIGMMQTDVDLIVSALRS